MFLSTSTFIVDELLERIWVENAPRSSAASLKAAIEALLKFMPRSEAEAITQAELFQKVVIATKSTGQKALRHLLKTGQIQRIAEGCKGNHFRYFPSA